MPVYAPATPTATRIASAQIQAATPTPVAAASATWENTLRPLLAAQCVACHGAVNPASGLSLLTYSSVLTGGKGGAGIVPGDPSASRLMTVQTEGRHPGQLSADALAMLKAWIEAGAPEK